VEVWWPATGKTNVIRDFEMDRFYQFTEGGAAAETVKAATFSWPRMKLALSATAPKQ